MSCKKVEKRKSLRSVDMKRETSLRVHMRCTREKSFSCRHAAWTSTGWPWVNHVDPPEPVVELEHRRRGWGDRVCSVLKREGYRETYPLPATASWEGTQTVLKGAQRGRGALTRAATWDITWEYIQGTKLFLFSGRWNTETEVQRIGWTFILGDAQNYPAHDPEQPDQMGRRLVSRTD